MNQNLADFLKNNGLATEIYDFEKEVLKFQETMTEGLESHDGKLRMLPTYVGVPDEIQPNTKVLVIDLGGTNLRAGLIGFDDQLNSEIIDIKKRKMPGVDSQVHKNKVFDAIAEMTADYVPQTDYVGFCFSNPFEFVEGGDAKVLHFGKELKVEGMVGSLIIKNLKEAWARKGINKEVSVTILNDTVSTLLMGKLLYPNRNVGGFVGFILGTGMNIAYVEANANIKKTTCLDLKKNQIINTESGDYPHFQRSKFDELLDESTQNVGHYFLEKMVSGAFVGRLVGIVIQEASNAGVISGGINAEINTKHVNDFVLDKKDGKNPLMEVCENNPNLRSDFFQIINVVLERAALLVSIQMAAVIRKNTISNNYDSPILVSIDGSSYAGEYFYRERIETYVRKNLTWDHGIYFQVIKPENASLLGASVAALGHI